MRRGAEDRDEPLHLRCARCPASSSGTERLALHLLPVHDVDSKPVHLCPLPRWPRVPSGARGVSCLRSGKAGLSRRQRLRGELNGGPSRAGAGRRTWGSYFPGSCLGDSSGESGRGSGLGGRWQGEPGEGAAGLHAGGREGDGSAGVQGEGTGSPEGVTLSRRVASCP